MMPSVSWKVLQVTDGQGQDATGRFVNGKNVTYQLSAGQTGTVFVPASQFDPDTVKSMVAAAAGNLAQVANLTSDS